jgi:hypothetical protein
MNWLIGIACVSALLATAAVVLIVRYGSDDHDLASFSEASDGKFNVLPERNADLKKPLGEGDERVGVCGSCISLGNEN